MLSESESVKEEVMLLAQPYLFSSLPSRLGVPYNYVALVSSLEANNHINGGTLAGAIATNEHHCLLLSHAETQVL
jgi:hypothetical protein